MTVAEQVGTGSSFGNLGRGRGSARGRAKAKAEGEIPEYDLVRIPLDRVATSPLNPRRNFGTEEELTEFGEELRRAQLAACVAVSLGAYLTLWPEHELQLAFGAEVVLLNGERRFRSGRQVGLETLDFVIRDDLAETRQSFLENLLKENLARQDFDLIERANGVAAMVQLCAVDRPDAPQKAAAARFGKDSSWVTNQLSLLTLPVEIQGLLSGKLMPERHGRVLARRLKKEPDLAASKLVDIWDELKEQEQQERLERKAEARRKAEAYRLAKAVGQLADTPAARAEVVDPGSQLSMDNSGTAEVPAAVFPSSDQLSMDNSDPRSVPVPRLEAEVPTALPPTAPSSGQLSMDNSQEPRPEPASAAVTSVVASGRPAQAVVELQVDASPSEQASQLALALGPERLAELWEEIHALMK